MKKNKVFINKNNSRIYNGIFLKETDIEIYTDGCSLGNPGPGGYGIVIIKNKRKKEISGGVKHTTNNRMELTACIIGLSELKQKTSVMIHSDSKYLINGISKGWAKRWEKNNWTGSNKKKVKNIDLWKKILKLCSKHEVQFKWIKGHNGNINNERCDTLAKTAAIKVKS